ncbi:MAG TPA: SPOR domain-containing protein [Thermoanaerobaculia bacterium]|nr:SPOR domain-containing protein [Thermoanaerobaculia bacterium]
MKRVVFALVIAACAQSAYASYAVRVSETVTVELSGATSAFAIDPEIAEVSVTRGALTVRGRAPGRTNVVVVTPYGQSTYAIIVEAAVAAPNRFDASGSATIGQSEVRYTSAPRTVQGTIAASHESRKTRTELQLQTIRHGSDRLDGEPQISIPSASLRFFRGRSELTLLDRIVDHTPLTISGTPLRGAHYLDDRWRIHAGYSAYTQFQSFLLPTSRELAIGASYAKRTGTSSQLITSLFAFPGADEMRSGTRGAVASVLYEYKPDDHLIARGEVAWGGKPGASAEVAYQSKRDQVRLDVRYRPRGFAGLSSVASGFFADGAWNTTLSPKWTADFGTSAYEYDLAQFQQRAVTGSGEVRFAATDALSIFTGARYGRFSTPSEAADTRSIVIPAGMQFQLAQFALGGTYRYSRNSTTNEGGHGIRLTARASTRSFHASGYFDYETQAPTLQLIFSESPELALALAELGITATTSEDIARALRDNAALIAQGFIEGVTIDLATARTQAGFDLAWIDPSEARRQLRFRLLVNRSEGVDAETTVAIASLSWSQQISAANDIVAAYSLLRTTAGNVRFTQPLVELSIRHRFNKLPSLPSLRGGTIAGYVFLDENLDGVADGDARIRDAEIELDGAHKTRTGANGSFAFRGVKGLTHQVVARLGSQSDAFFTTPSRVETTSGGEVRFGVAYTPARAIGTVVDDVGDGIAGLTLVASRGEHRFQEITNGNGKASVALPTGEWEISISPSSVPPGYSLTTLESQTVSLERGKSADVRFLLKANRSISGRVVGARSAEVTIEPTGRRMVTDKEGRYSFRSLLPGTYTIATTVAQKRITRSVTIPRAPATLKDVDLAASEEPQISAVATEAVGERPGTMYFVQLGVYRQPENATATATRARSAGFEPQLVADASTTIVRVGPFTTVAEAKATAEQLQRVGMETAVLSVN